LDVNVSVFIGILMLLVSQLQAEPADLFGPIEDGDVARVKQLLAKGADVNQKDYNNCRPLRLAEDPVIVEVLLRYKPDLEVVDSSECQTPLQHAAFEAARKNEDSKKWRKIVKLLLDAGAEYDIVSAIHLDDIDRVRTILNKNPNAALGGPEDSEPPLRAAAGDGREEICALLLKHKADPEDTERGCGYPILRYAVKYPKVVKLLIDAGANPTQRITWNGGRTGVWLIGDDATALHYAAGEGVPETVTLLIDHGVDIFATAHDIADKKMQQTALEVAALFGEAENAQAIVTHRKFDQADAKLRQRVLDKSLVIGAALCSLTSDDHRAALLEVLLSKGANANAREEGQSAIQAAARQMHPTEAEKSEVVFHPTSAESNEIIQKEIAVLRRHGAVLDLCSAVAIGDDVEVKRLLQENPKSANDRFHDGYPALHFAVDMDYKNVVTALLKAGCDVSIRNRSEETGGPSETALQSAAFWGRDDLAKLLVDSGADVNAKDDKGGTPLSEAVRLHNAGIVRLLLNHGAKLDGVSDENANPEIRRILDEFRAKANLKSE
jgi:ankyrin repeat protein